MEQQVNRWESREAVKFLLIYLVGIPLLVGYAVSRVLFLPALDHLEARMPTYFQLTEKQKVEGARKLHMEELRVRMNMAIGRIPALSEMELLVHLHEDALEVEEEERAANRQGLLNLVSDGISATTFFACFNLHTFGRAVLFRTVDRFVGSVSETAKAFVIILTADILLGYHSEEGWASFINIVTRHYGYEVEEEPVYVFIAIVPVTLDAMFKYWIFRGLNRFNPSSAVTLKEMDRH